LSVLPQKERCKVDNNRYEEIFICFKRNSTKVWHKLLDDEFGHCFVIIKLRTGGWMILEPTVHGLDARLPSIPDIDYPMFLKNRLKVRVVKITQPEKCFAMITTPVFGWQSCTMWVKYMLGVRQLWVWTPKQLYNCLMKKYGGVEL
jgi:hypothetical protein